MTCEETANLISARIDGELSGGAEAALDAHLAGCCACRAVMFEMEVQDAGLLRAFMPRQEAALELADRMSRIVEQESIGTRPTGRFRPRVWRLAAWAAAAAAGFVAAIVLVKPPARPATSFPSATLRPAARLTLAIGDVYTSASEPKAWRPIQVGAAIDRGAAVRTADAAKCELLLPDGSCVRLDSGTEARFAGDRDVQISTGQLWSTVPPNALPICVSAGQTSVTAGGTKNDTGTEFQFASAPHEATVTVQRGTADVTGNGPRTMIHGGQTLRAPSQSFVFSCTAVSDPDRLLRWQDDLLSLKPGDDPEVIARVGQLLSQIATDKGTTGSPCVVEQEIRAHGQTWSTSIACCLKDSAKINRPETRQAAARLLSDLATSSNIADLIALLDDGDGAIRSPAAAALSRLSGQTLGYSSEHFAVARDPTAGAAWRNWWDQNKSRHSAGK